MWLKRFFWRWIVSRMARSGGFIDPLEILSRLENFAQPAEVKEPLELLRAGMLFHARGLLNTGAIQHNLDWIWPFWVVRQYDPHDPAFIPLAFSLTHINLTHRNWTAIGLPDLPELPIVDPSGLLTPFWDGWSLDLWLAAEDGRRLYPSRLPAVEQHLETTDGLAVYHPLPGRGLGDHFPRRGLFDGRSAAVSADRDRQQCRTGQAGRCSSPLQPGRGQLPPCHPYGGGPRRLAS